ncbi:MAG: hypothetical protein LBM99_00965 [Bacillales bacterium]|nr:hypothetical protein [Bacillales bacterium]
MKNKKITFGIWALSLLTTFLLGVSFSNLLKGNSYENEEIEILANAYQTLKKEWYFGNDNLTYEEALQEMLTSGKDRYTHYDLPGKPTTSETLYGIGVGIISVVVEGKLLGYEEEYKETGNYGITVTKIFDNGPSANILFKKDAIMGVVIEGEEILFEGKTYSEATSYLYAKKDVVSTYIIIRDGVTLYKEISHYSFETKQVNIINNDVCSTCLAVSVSSFSESSTNELKNIFKNNETKNKDLYLNFKDNGGGYVSIMQSMADLFLPKDLNLSIFKDRDNKASIGAKTVDNNDYEFNSITLHLNQNSASATEAFALAMRYYSLTYFNKFQIVGTQSYGKGIAQRTVTYQNGSSLTYTFAKLFDPSGISSIHEVGLAPNYQIAEATWENSGKEMFKYLDDIDDVVYQGLLKAGELGNEV